MLVHTNLVMRLYSQLSIERTEDMNDVLLIFESSLQNLTRESNILQVNEQGKEEKERKCMHYILHCSSLLLPFVSYPVRSCLNVKRRENKHRLLEM